MPWLVQVFHNPMPLLISIYSLPALYLLVKYLLVYKNSSLRVCQQPYSNCINELEMNFNNIIQNLSWMTSKNIYFCEDIFQGFCLEIFLCKQNQPFFFVPGLVFSTISIWEKEKISHHITSHQLWWQRIESFA